MGLCNELRWCLDYILLLVLFGGACVIFVNCTTGSIDGAYSNDTSCDLNSSTDQVTAPESQVWNYMGGQLASNPYQIRDNQGKNHVLVRGSDNGLWDNVDAGWQGLGGSITADPFALKDGQGKIHVLARGGDGALWDKVLGGSWTCLGGYITSNPSAALNPVDNHLKAAVKGGDNSLWIKDITTGAWSSRGGMIASNPQLIFDSNGKMHALAKGSDGALWDNVNGNWQSRGGYLTSDPHPIQNPSNPDFIYTFARGGDGALWRNDLNTNSNTATWQGLGGFISPNSGDLFKGNPAPVVDADGVIRAFVRGGDGSLWGNVNGNWYSMGGHITSDPSPVSDPTSRSLDIATRGGDGALWSNTNMLYRAHGLDFSPYMDGQSPNLHSQISEDQLRARMKIVAPYTKWVRTFGCTEGLEKAGLIAHELGLKIAVGAWLEKNGPNDQQISSLIQIGKAGQADVLIVGSETLSLGGGRAITEDELISYINQVKREVPGVPVTYGFTYNDLNNQRVVSAVDIVYANIYPFYAGPYGINIDLAINNMDSAYYQYAIPRAQGKQVVISETGWPSSGYANGAAVPSSYNAAKYFKDFDRWARDKNVAYFYFESFDESWKSSENSWGPFWGIWDKNGALKPGMIEGFKL